MKCAASSLTTTLETRSLAIVVIVRPKKHSRCCATTYIQSQSPRQGQLAITRIRIIMVRPGCSRDAKCAIVSHSISWGAALTAKGTLMATMVAHNRLVQHGFASNEVKYRYVPAGLGRR